MANIISSSLNWFRNLGVTKLALGGVVLVAVVAGGYFIFAPKNANYQFVTVEKGSITETVSVTGNTTPVSSVSLGFGGSGNIASVNSSVGKIVGKGQVLASLNTSDLYSQVQQAQANLDSQQAKLQGLQAGARPEDVAASQAALDKANQDLSNMYTGIGDTSVDSYAKASDAVRTQINEFFSNADANQPKLTYLTSNSQAQIDAESQRVGVGADLDNWQSQLNSIDQSNAGLETLLKKEIIYLNNARQLLNNLSKTLESAPSLSASMLASYKAAVTAALNEVNTASKNLNTVSQNISSQKLAVSQSQAQLNLKKAGSSPQDIAAQQAQVANAQAQVTSAQSKLQNSQIVAPISGVITQFDAKVGQYASPGSTLISIISASSFEVDTQVSETDVGKITIGNKVSMTLDAFPGETFTGSVSYIDPAQTNNEGVVGYKVKITFDTDDKRLKSGLTVNINIETRNKDNILVLPQYAILQNDDGTFVQVLEDKAVKNIPVTLGIQDQSGNVEIVSGVTEGEQVLNIGLKTQ